MISFRCLVASGITLLFVLISLMLNQPRALAAQIELYGTFHAMGIIVTLESDEDPDMDARAVVEYRNGSDGYLAGFPLSRIARDRFVGSLFWLDPGTMVDVRVTISDPDGGTVNGAVLASSATTRPEITVPSPLSTHYVHPQGSGSACTIEAPCTLAQGLAQAGAGEAVALRGGTYYTGDMDIPNSGANGAPIVIRGHEGETAVLDGADPATFTWRHQGGGIYSTTANTTDVHLVLADGQRLFPYESLDDLIDLVWDDTPGFFQEGTTLYVHLENQKNPASAAMVISRHEHAFTVERDYIYFIDLTFTHYGQGGYPKAIYLNNASDNLVRGCAFIDNDLGVGIKRASHRNVIEESLFSDTIFDWPWDGIKGVGRLEDGGISFYDPVTGRGNVIRRNTFHDDFDGMGVCPSATAALTNETDVYDNVVYRMGDDGMETDGQCSNVRIWGNTFHDVLMGISLAPVYDGPVYALRNLIYRTGVGNNNYSGSPFKFNSGYDRSGPMYLFHNTSDAALPGNNGIYIKAPGSWDLIYARNNIWAGTNYAINDYNTSQPLDLDYDNLYNGGANDLARWNNSRYGTLAEFSAATGLEHNGWNVNPNFINPNGGLYHLDPASDLVDEGESIPGINHDYYGQGPDIGAFEVNTGNRAPVAANDQAVTSQETAVTIDVISGDNDADGDPLAIHDHSATSANGGRISQPDNEHLTYTPAAGFSGTDTFTYRATDGQAPSNTATVTITVESNVSGPDPGDAANSANNGDSSTVGGGGGGGCFIRILDRDKR